MNATRLNFFACLIMLLFLTSGTVNAQSLPSKVRSYLDQNYKGWTFASYKGSAMCSDETNVLTGDFDGNRQKDVALKIHHEQKYIILAFLKRGKGYSSEILSIDSTNYSWLRVEKKDSEVFDYSANRNMRFSNDTISEGMCQSIIMVAYIYQDRTFKKVSMEVGKSSVDGKFIWSALGRQDGKRQ